MSSVLCVLQCCYKLYVLIDSDLGNDRLGTQDNLGSETLQVFQITHCP